jgi:hypothetical protein
MGRLSLADENPLAFSIGSALQLPQELSGLVARGCCSRPVTVSTGTLPGSESSEPAGRCKRAGEHTSMPGLDPSLIEAQGPK